MVFSQDVLDKAVSAIQSSSTESSEPVETAAAEANEPEETPIVENSEPSEPEPTLNVESETVKVKEKDESFDKLAEKEREFRRQELEFKRRERDLSKKFKELEGKESKLKDPNNILDILDAHGLTLEQFQRKILEGNINLDKPEVDPETEAQNKLQQELSDLKEWKNQQEQERVQAEAEHYQSVYRNSIQEAVPQFENLTEWFDGELQEVVDEAYKAAELYAEEHDEAPEIDEILSQLDSYYGKKLTTLKAKYKKEEPAPVKAEKTAKTSGKSLGHNDTRNIAPKTEADINKELAKRNPSEVIAERAFDAFRRAGTI